MNGADPVLEQLKTRQLVAEHLPQMAQGGLGGQAASGGLGTQAVQAEWAHWLRAARRSPKAGAASQRLYVVIRPISVEDMQNMVGLAQLFDIRWCAVRLVVLLPNPQAAHLFRDAARRQGLDQLLHILDQAAPQTAPQTIPQAVFQRFPKDAILCHLPGNVVLTANFIDALRDTVAGVRTGAADALGTAVARAGCLGDHLSAPGPKHGLSVALSSLVRGRPGAERLGPRAIEMMRRSFTKAAARAPAPAASGPNPQGQDGALDPDPAQMNKSDGRLQLAQVPPNAEIVIEADALSDGPVFYRQAAALVADKPLHIAPPLELVNRCTHALRASVLQAGTCLAHSSFDLEVPASQLRPWMVTCYLNRGGAGNDVIRAFAEGIGAQLAFAEDTPLPQQGVPVVWGVLRGSDQIVAHARQRDQYFFYIDHAYFDRGHGKNYRITRNGYEAGPIRQCPSDRIRSLGVAPKPWRKGGTEIIVCPPTDYFMQAHNCADWLETTLDRLKRHTDRPLVIRTKPKPGETTVPLPQALETAHALVTHSSNVAIEAAVLGTPVYVAATSAAASIGQTDLAHIETPIYPDRDPWLAHLAYNQFSLDEIRSGHAWRMLLQSENRPFV